MVEDDPLPRYGAFAEELRKRYGEDVDPRITLGDGDAAGDDTGQSPASAELLRRLAAPEEVRVRYRLKGEVARGGMGTVLEVWDADLRRSLAMKVVHGQDRLALGRFLEEAQVTGQLDHPGIVPVHELGLDEAGRVYFTMRLVKGRELRRIFERVHEDDEAWTITRALGLLLKVCEAMAFAHAKGVIHRDLKPANVMVGRFGEVYVMDWGLARILGQEDRHDVRLDISLAGPISVVESERAREAAESPDDAIRTMDGDIVGTPAYMSPEQARGHVDRLDARTDVYAMGAMLYHLIAGRMPFVPPKGRVSPRTVLLRVLEGPPAPLEQLAPSAPGELVAICEKAMAREAGERYADMQELADDLRAFLEHRVVKAHQTGAWAEFRKWMERNRALATTVLLATLLVVGGSVVASVVLAAAADEARRERSNVLRLSAFQELADLRAQADALWPATPERVGEYEAWLRRARSLIAGLEPDEAEGDPGHRAQLELIRSRSVEGTGGASDGAADAPRAYSFEVGEDRWWHAQLEKLVAELDAFGDDQTGCVRGLAPPFGWGIERRLDFARNVLERTVSGPRARALWDRARASIADASECPAYGGLELEPQIGLLPIGRDPDSGLWEFAHVLSGALPERDADGRLLPTEETCVVLVLIPGGTFWMGAQRSDPAGPNHDSAAHDNEGPAHEVELSPYFLSKYELTQGQWLRFLGENPSLYGPGLTYGDKVHDLAHPVERVTWGDCDEALRRMGLALPTEAQWEHAARAGTGTPWWTGAERDSLAGRANVADAYCEANGGPARWDYEPWSDGWAMHARVGALPPNAFGLHEVIGNVWEWCADGYSERTYSGGPRRDPYLDPGANLDRIGRGGGFYGTADKARVSARAHDSVERGNYDVGVRPARAVSR